MSENQGFDLKTIENNIDYSMWLEMQSRKEIVKEQNGDSIDFEDQHLMT